MPNLIDDFQGQAATYYRQLILGNAYVGIGSRLLASASPTTNIAITTAPGISTEPIYIGQLLPQSPAVAQGIAELFQTKLISAWFDLLGNLFAQFVTEHLGGVKLHPELKQWTARIDLSLNVDVKAQVRDGLINEFLFQPYKERIRAIVRILEPGGSREGELSIVKKHVLIRNSIQHHGSCVYADMLKELGSARLRVLDEAAAERNLNANDKITLSVPELDHLKGALFRITSAWRDRVA